MVTKFISVAVFGFILSSISQLSGASYTSKSRFNGKFECTSDLNAGYFFNTDGSADLVEYTKNRKIYIAHLTSFDTAHVRSLLKFYGYRNADSFSRDSAMAYLEEVQLKLPDSRSSLWTETGSFVVSMAAEPGESELLFNTGQCESISVSTTNRLKCDIGNGKFIWDMGTGRFTYLDPGTFHRIRHTNKRVDGSTILHGTCTRYDQ
jgi:hypothetical protein